MIMLTATSSACVLLGVIPDALLFCRGVEGNIWRFVVGFAIYLDGVFLLY